MRRLTPPDRHAIQAAARALRDGELVVFPTETVYGLGADAENRDAVRRIFSAKGRPTDNPVIVHILNVAMARDLTAGWNETATELARRFWPGPLTLVIRKSARVPAEVAGGLDTVAVRVPDHPVALDLLRECGFPIAAPSANKSGRPSPTRCEDARADLGDAVAVYLDGGATRVGVESTVIDLTRKRPTLLRLGGVAREAIEAVVGPLAAAGKIERPLAPGMNYKHYAPQTPMRVAENPAKLAELWREFNAARGARSIAWLVSSEADIAGPDVTVVASRDDADVWAHRLFALLRDADRGGHDLIVVEAIPEAGLGAAVMDRLRRATQK